MTFSLRSLPVAALIVLSLSVPAQAKRERPATPPPPAERPAPVAPSDFTYSAPLKAENGDNLKEGVLYRLPLPASAALNRQRQDGADLAAFSAQGEILPFAVLDRTWESSRSEIKAASLYPLWGKTESRPEELEVSFVLDENARLVPRVTGKSINEAPAGQVLKGYILPLPKEGVTASSMRFSWTKGAENTLRFSIQTGDDLKSWRTITSSATLVRFDGPDGPLESSAVPLHSAALGKYLRLIFAEGAEGASIQDVTMEEWSSSAPKAEYAVIKGAFLPAKQADAKNPYSPAALDFILPQDPAFTGYLNVENIQAEAASGSYAAVQVYTRPSDKEEWHRIGAHTFFTVAGKEGSAPVQSPPFELHRRTGQIRLTSVNPDKPLPKDFTLTLSYVPSDLYVMAQGPGPHILAWNSKREAPDDPEGIRTLRQLAGEARTASIGDISAPPKAPEPEAKTETAGGMNMRFALWGLLGAGVLLLAFMALHLVRNMKTEE